jgi:hypothetical protein
MIAMVTGAIAMMHLVSIEIMTAIGIGIGEMMSAATAIITKKTRIHRSGS